MEPRLTLRVQLAIALAIVLAFGLVLQTVATVGVIAKLRIPAEAAVSSSVIQPGTAAEVMDARARRVTPWLLAYLALSNAIAFVAGTYLLHRWFARRVDRLAAAADRIGRLELDGVLSRERGAGSLGQLDHAFERMAMRLKEEQGRTARQIAELRRLNGQLAEVRASLIRSEKLATVGRLAAGVAHEVGNPLGAILGYLELARSRRPVPEVCEYLDRIDHEVARIDRTVRELLHFSHPGPEGVSLQPLALRAAVEGAVRLAAVQTRLRGVLFQVEVPQELQVLAEEHHLTQVLINVLLNAGDAMKGEGTVTFRARRVEAEPGRRASDPPPGARIELEIADTGPGFAQADLALIFDPFFTTKEPGEGTGLGLAICHRIMETFGGEIAADNGPGGGAVFTLVFREPAQAASPGLGAAADERQESGDP